MAERFDRYLDRLAKAKVEHATHSLTSPKDRDAFEFGRVTGFYQGLLVAEQLVNEVLAEEEKDRHDRSNKA
jgi:hypothetical protein